MKFLRSHSHQWIRHLVQLSVLLSIVAVAFAAHYKIVLSQNQVETVRRQETASLPRSAILAMDRLFRGSTASETDSQENRAKTLERLKKIRGNTWSAEVYGLSLTDPLAGAESLAASKNVNRALLIGLLIPVAATLLLGRFFCSWICPAGFLFDMADKLRALLAKSGLPFHHTTLWHGTKYVLLGTGLALSFVFAIPLLGFFYPPALVGRGIHAGVDSFFNGLADPPHTAGAITLTAVSLFLLGIMFVEIFISRRLWCRTLCPGGALYTLLGAARVVRVKNDRPRCTHCTECIKVCPMGLNPMAHDTPGPECDHCLACLPACAPGSLSLELGLPRIFPTTTKPPRAGKSPLPRGEGQGEGKVLHS
jgi:ferredoxin-type protein NapH